MSRASPGSFAGYFPTAAAARKQKHAPSQQQRSTVPQSDAAESSVDDSSAAEVAAADRHGSQHTRRSLGHDATSPRLDQDDKLGRPHEPGDMLNGIGSASSLTSAASSVLTNGSGSTMPTHGDASGIAPTLTPLTNLESSPARRSPTPSRTKVDLASKHVNNQDFATSTSHGIESSYCSSQLTPTSTPLAARIEARPGPGDAKGRRIILDPELGPGKAQKLKKATYRDFGAQEFRPPPDPRLAIPGYKDGRLEPTIVEPVRMWKQRLRFSPYQLQPYVWDDQISVGTGPACGIVVTGYDRLLPESQLRAFFSSFGEISSLLTRTDPITGTPLAVCSVQYRDSHPHRGPAVLASDAAKRAEAEGNGQRIGISTIKVERDRVGRKAERAVQKEAGRLHEKTTREPTKTSKPNVPTAPAKMLGASSPAPPKDAPREPRGLTMRPMDAPRGPQALPPKIAAQSLIEKSILSTIKRKPYVFISHVHVPVMGTTLPHLKKRMKMYDWEEIRCDTTGYFIIFADSKRGEDEAVRCFKLSNGQPLFTYTMTLECQQYGNPNYERSPSPERLLELQKSKEADERLRKEEADDALEEMRQRALHLDPTKAALEQLREELLDKIINDVKTRIAAPALFEYLNPDTHAVKRRKLNIPDPVEQQQRVGPTYIGQLADDSASRTSNNRFGPAGIFRKGRAQDFVPLRKTSSTEPINAFADERRQQPAKRRVEVKSLHHRLHEFLEDDDDDDDSEDGRQRRSREDTRDDSSQIVSRRSSSPPSDDEDTDSVVLSKAARERLRADRVDQQAAGDDEGESGDEDWGIARQLLDPHLIKKAPEDMAARELQLIIGTLPAHSKLHKHAKRELLIRKRSKADDRLFHIKAEDIESPVDKLVADIQLPDTDSQTELDAREVKPKTKVKRKTKKQLLEEREIAAVSAKALLQDVEEAATPEIAMSNLSDLHAETPDAAEEVEEEERADVEWGVSTDRPRRTVEDDPDLVLDIDGWQHLVKDDEDYQFLRMALADVLPAPLGDAKRWAAEQKTIKSLNREVEHGTTNKPTCVEGYYIPNLTGSIRTEGVSKIFESEKSKYLPHRLRVAAARERRDETARTGTPLTTSAESQRQGKVVSNATGRAARASNRTQVKDLNTTKQNLAEGQQGDAIRFNNLKKRKKLVKFDRSAIHGWGLYAEENIAMNDMIIEYVGEKVRQAVANIREIKYDKQGMGSSYLFRIDEDTVVDATKKGGIARFINHSCAPNCTAKIIRVDGTKRIVIYALKEITKDEELTYDYKFDREMNNDDRIPCLCGSEVCKGFLN